MSARPPYELLDTVHPDWRGPGFTDPARAHRERETCERSYGAPVGRYVVIDRVTRRPVDRSGAPVGPRIGRA